MFQEVDYRQEVARIRKKVEKSQDSIAISCSPANLSELDLVTNQKKIRVLHLITNVEVIDGTVFFAFEKREDIGVQENVESCGHLQQDS